MPKDLKAALREDLQERAKELGLPDLVDKIADETITTDADELAEDSGEGRSPGVPHIADGHVLNAPS